MQLDRVIPRPPKRTHTAVGLSHSWKQSLVLQPDMRQDTGRESHVVAGPRVSWQMFPGRNASADK